jgi:3-oxoacyl-[acyl-carrier protein] reductase
VTGAARGIGRGIAIALAASGSAVIVNYRHSDTDAYDVVDTITGMRAQKWGRIVMVSSIAAQDGGIIGPHYAASKAGMLGLARSYARLLARDGITCNAITPALIDTDMVRANSAASPDLIPVGRFGSVDEVASLVVALAANGYVTGQTIGINGGRYVN